MLVKGIMTAEDARCGDGVHHRVEPGGRSMDYGPATLEALPEIVAAVNGRIPIIVDSGFRRGSNVLKALAIGQRGDVRPGHTLGARRVRVPACRNCSTT
jgi:isopentenyl diphosphate isomerase/L-lactate dehydrogenase-like FMN-dependent dehydrogenase